MHALVLSLAIAATAVTASGPETGVDAPQVVDTAAQVRALCEALTPKERFVAHGGAVDRARAESEHDANRQAALARVYRVEIPARHLRFDPYAPDETQLALSERAYLIAAGGVLHVWAVDEPQLPVTVDAPTADRILGAASDGTLNLTVTFTLAGDDEEIACAHPNGSRVYGLGVRASAWEYADAERLLARGGDGADRPLATIADGARPIIDVGIPSGGAADAVHDSVEARHVELEACYRRALQRDPALDGTIVAEVGSRAAVHIAVDSVQDDALATCVRDVLGTVALPGAGRDRVQIPIHFRLEQPTADAR